MTETQSKSRLDACAERCSAWLKEYGPLCFSLPVILEKSERKTPRELYFEYIRPPLLRIVVVVSVLQCVTMISRLGFFSALLAAVVSVPLALLIYRFLHYLVIAIFRKVQSDRPDLARDSSAIALCLLPCFLYGLPLSGVFGAGVLLISLLHSGYLSWMAMTKLSAGTPKPEIMAARMGASYAPLILLLLLSVFGSSGRSGSAGTAEEGMQDALTAQMQMMLLQQRYATMSNAQKATHDTIMNTLNNMGSKPSWDH